MPRAAPTAPFLILRTLAIAAAGAGLFALIGLPLPLLLGPMFAALAAALSGIELRSLPLVPDAMRAVLGLAVGTSITGELLGRLGDFALSVALVPVFVAVIAAIGYPYFRRLCRFDPVTAYYAAMPGGLQDMILFGIEAGGHGRALSLVHATRVLVIVAVMPIIITQVWDRSLDQPLGAPAASLPLSDLLMMMLCAAIGWPLGRRIGLFGAAILGPLILSALASIAGLIDNRPPQEAIWAAQFFIGTVIGTYYMGTTAEEVRRVLSASVGYCLILAVLALAFAEVVFLLGAAPAMEAGLAFAPGGQAEMVVLALVAGADMAYVVTIHLSRIVVVILGAPIVARLMKWNGSGDQGGQDR
ncbi:MAG: AbrB family transcriptional regulator [Pseudomonadota bacterium]